MYFGFEASKDGVNEFYPLIFKDQNIQEKRKAFLVQFNLCVGEVGLKLSLNSKTSLHESFNNKINELILQNPAKNSYEKNLINLYLSKEYEKISIMPKISQNPAIKLINLLYAKENQGLCFNASMLFESFVFEKIKKIHSFENVTMRENIIILNCQKHQELGILPCFKHILQNDPKEANEDIQNAFYLLKKYNLPQLYLVFPRHENFRKHISIRTRNSDDIKLKLVPYSITNTIISRR